MNILFKTVEGTQGEMPLELERTKTCIYVRKNIEEIEDEERGIYYVYEEAKLSPKEYEEYTKSMNSPATLEILQALSEIQAEQMYNNLLINMRIDELTEVLR